jgi:peptidoglycan L-alanyl-D-glutamate endopeptidase CwlK
MYKFSATSLERLKGVHPKLVAVAQKALEYSQYDFGIAWMGGLRTGKEQAELMKQGATKTMLSKHRQQEDGYGHAFDVLPWVDGKANPNALPTVYYEIVLAVSKAAREQGVAIKWGGCWQTIGQFTDSKQIRAKTQEYIDSKRRIGKKAFVDMPHFELVT